MSSRSFFSSSRDWSQRICSSCSGSKAGPWLEIGGSCVETQETETSSRVARATERNAAERRIGFSSLGRVDRLKFCLLYLAKGAVAPALAAADRREVPRPQQAVRVRRPPPLPRQAVAELRRRLP